jgi:hypothetical protein
MSGFEIMAQDERIMHYSTFIDPFCSLEIEKSSCEDDSKLDSFVLTCCQVPAKEIEVHIQECLAVNKSLEEALKN